MIPLGAFNPAPHARSASDIMRAEEEAGFPPLEAGNAPLLAYFTHRSVTGDRRVSIYSLSAVVPPSQAHGLPVGGLPEGWHCRFDPKTGIQSLHCPPEDLIDASTPGVEPGLFARTDSV